MVGRTESEIQSNHEDMGTVYGNRPVIKWMPQKTLFCN